VTKKFAVLIIVLSSILSSCKSKNPSNLCFHHPAGNELNTLIAGGMSGDEALKIVEEEYLDGTRQCLYKMRGQVSKLQFAYPYAYRYLFGN
tara:strand:+ start:279 stop:551 length:273 start_codon:yes stop_codon:yes gene_type:complete